MREERKHAFAAALAIAWRQALKGDRKTIEPRDAAEGYHMLARAERRWGLPPQGQVAKRFLADRIVDDFNERYPIGTPMRYRSVRSDDGSFSGDTVDGVLTVEAYVDPAGQPVAFLDNLRGCVSVFHLQPHPTAIVERPRV
jgi:hypothetical protein